jgi:hypothetical protein
VVAGHKIELVVAAPAQPARYHIVGKPGAPAPLHPHSRVNLRDAERDTTECQRKEHRGEPEDGRGVAVFDGIKDVAIPHVDAVLHGDVEND